MGKIFRLLKESSIMIKKYNYISHDSHGNSVLDVSSLLTSEDVIVLAENGLMDEEGYLISDIDQYLVEQENYELNEVLKKLKSAAKKAGKHVWKHKKKYAAGALAVGGAALIGKSKLKARQNRRNETQAAAANQRLADDEAKVKAKKEAEDNKKVSGAKPVQQQKPNANPNQIKKGHALNSAINDLRKKQQQEIDDQRKTNLSSPQSKAGTSERDQEDAKWDSYVAGVKSKYQKKIDDLTKKSKSESLFDNSNVDYDLRSIADSYMDQVVSQSYVEESENSYAENIKESLKSRLGSAAIGAGVGAASGAATHATNWLRDKERTWVMNRLKKKGKKMTSRERATLKALKGDKMQDAYHGRKLGRKELLKKMLGGAALVGGATAIQDPLGQMGKYGVTSEYEPEGEQIEEKKKRDWSKDTPYLLRDLKTADKITSSLGKEYKKNAAQRKKNWKKVGKAVGKTKVGKFGKALWKKGAAANKKAKQNRDNYYSGKDYKDVMGNTKKGYNNYL